MQKVTIHLIPNAHLDPVWLWDWREGLNEGIATCRAVLNLMDEVPELTFIRGEAVIYQHLERHDPQTFRRIQKYAAQGRWDVVGGTWLQPDTNMPATETFARHFCHGQTYFREKFGKPVRVAWAADSFGHCAGLPAILTAADIRGFAFTRPQPFILPIPKSAFWWESAGGARVLAYRPPIGWYGTERDEVGRRLDEVLVAAQKDGLENVGCFFGLGNHGGGPTRRQLAEIALWSQKHPDIRVMYSGLHRLFDALYAEVGRKGKQFLPTHRGELNFCQRGCYASVAKFKYAYRRTEAMLASAERTDAVISAGLRRPFGDLRAAWDSVLFNSFHDILPGSSIERAYDEQLAWLGLAQHQAQSVGFDALNALAMRLDTSVPQTVGDHPTAVPLLVWNPHPHSYVGHVELEACLDYRPIWAYSDRVDQLPVEVRGPQGQLMPFQLVATEHHAMVNLAWRKRAIVPVTLPPLGWSVLTMGWVEGAKQAERASVPLAVNAVVGDGCLRLWDKISVSAITVEDPWGSWGGMDDPLESRNLSVVRHNWKISRVETLERGPERSSLWVEMLGGNSRLELRISQSRGQVGIDFSARVLWNQRDARLKLVFSGAGECADFDVPGGSVTRGPLGEVPGGRWVRTAGFGFVSDSLYGFDLTDGALRATVVRASRYCDDTKTGADTAAWLPPTDAGELRFRFALTPANADLPRLSRELEQPPLVLLVPAKKGKLAREGSFLDLAPGSLQLLALKRAEDGRGLILRVQQTAGRKVRGHLTWLGQRIELGSVAAFEVATWRIVGRKATRTNILERSI
ncbi:MAG: glycoside hydrolase family 38 [Phycisphaerae bacterium]|nr:glycoside hydrolase family 38 [Phycisphaerae bacterium]